MAKKGGLGKSRGQGVPDLVVNGHAAKVVKKWKKCGKKNCRCAQGDLHGPYLYLQWREGNRVYQEYLGRAKEIKEGNVKNLPGL